MVLRMCLQLLLQMLVLVRSDLYDYFRLVKASFGVFIGCRSYFKTHIDKYLRA